MLIFKLKKLKPFLSKEPIPSELMNQKLVFFKVSSQRSDLEFQDTYPKNKNLFLETS